MDRVSSDRYPTRRKWLDRNGYRSSVSDRCIPNWHCSLSGIGEIYEAVMQGILRHFSFDGNYYHFLNSDNKDGQINTDIFVAFLYLSVVKCILVASPGFVKDQFISYLFKEAVRQDCKLLLENRSKFMVVHSSSGHKYSLKGQYSVQLSKVKMCKIFIID